MTKSVEDILASFEFSSSDAAKVKKGEVINRVASSTNERELAGFFALLVDADLEALRETFLTSSIKKETDEAIAQLENIEDPENPDFSSLKLNDAIAKDLLSSKKGDPFNLSADEYALFHALGKKATTAQVEDVMKKILKQRCLDYHHKGLEGIAPYQRSREAYEPGKELHLKTSKSPKMKELFPQFYKYLLEYPNSKPDKGHVIEAFCWMNFTIDDKPTICLSHKVGYFEDVGFFAVCDRHFYVSRGHNSVQMIAGGFETDDQKTLCLAVSRTSTDQVTGFGGAAKKTIGAKIMCGRLADNFQRRQQAMAKK